MRIGIVLYPTFGGSGVVATELGKALARKGHQIHFISYSQPVRLDMYTENVFYHEVNVPTYPLFDFAPYEVALTSMLVNVALHEKLDVIHVHYAIPHASAAYLAKQILKDKGIHVPIICTLHGTDITLVGRDVSYEPVITFAINNCDAVTTVSESLRQDTLKHFEVTRPIEVIYNFIDNQQYTFGDDDCLRKYTAPHGEKVVVHISNFRKVKRVQDVVQAFAIIRQHMPARLVMVGDGPERSGAEELSRTLGVARDVLFLGKIKQTENVLNCADLFMLPSDSESFGLSALEAMACGVPVISTNAGGMPEVQIQGKTGFMSAVGDFEDMAKNGLYILQDEHRLQTFRAEAKQRAHDFDITKILPVYEALYTRVVSEVRPTVAL